MLEVADIIRRDGAALRAHLGDRLLPSQVRPRHNIGLPHGQTRADVVWLNVGATLQLVARNCRIEQAQFNVHSSIQGSLQFLRIGH